MFEVKRGTSSHDAGKKKNILRTFLETAMHLKHYAIDKQGLDVTGKDVKIVSYYGDKQFHNKIHLDKDSLDDFLDIEIVEDVEAVTHLYRKRIIDTINEKTKELS